jgi:hypothetical protein
MLQANMSLDQAIDFLFLRNTENAQVFLSLHQLQGVYDLFLFCVDVLCKGLIALFANGATQLDLQHVTPERIDIIKERLICAGIKLHVDYQHLDRPLETRVPYIVAPPDCQTLEEHKLVMIIGNTKVTIWFSLTYPQGAYTHKTYCGDKI